MMKKIAVFTIAAVMMITTCIPVFATPASTQAQTPAATAVLPIATVTAEQAKAIALVNAGFAAKDVTFVKNQLEFDDGILQYDIEFVNGQTEYEYDIDATTGAILSVDIDLVHTLF